MRLGLRDANQHFSKVVKAVRSGKDVVLTDRGRLFAVIKPLIHDKAGDLALQAMADEGLITPAARKGRLPPVSGRAVRVRGATISQTVIDGREDSA